MTRVPVQSSNVLSVGYDVRSETMEVAYRPNREGVIRVYRYENVTLAQHEHVMTSESVGRAVRMVASAPHVVCTRLDDEQAA
jgi:hypothetical protein